MRTILYYSIYSTCDMTCDAMRCVHAMRCDECELEFKLEFKFKIFKNSNWNSNCAIRIFFIMRVLSVYVGYE